MPEEQKTYVNALQIKEITFRSGKKILKVSVNVNRMIEFLQQHANERGYVNLGISSRNSTGNYGETHCAWLDTWQPDASRRSENHRPHPAPRPDKDVQEPPESVDDSDVPF